MSNNAKYIGGAAVLVLLAIIGVRVVSPVPAPAPQPQASEQQYQQPTNTVSSDDQKYGATPGTSVNGPLFTVGGLDEYSYRVPANIGSTTDCAILTPNATTTVTGFPTLSTSIATTSASLVEIGVGATPGATTTLMSRWTIAANARGTAVATTTATAPTDGLISPLQWVNFKHTGGGTSDGTTIFTDGGVCTLKLRTVR